MGNVSLEASFKEMHNKEVSKYKFDMSKFKGLPSPERFKQLIVDVIDFIDNNMEYFNYTVESADYCTNYDTCYGLYNVYVKNAYGNIKNVHIKSMNDYIEFVTKVICDDNMLKFDYDDIVKVIAHFTLSKQDVEKILPEIKDYAKSLKSQPQQQANAAAAMNINNMVPGYMNFVQQQPVMQQQPQMPQHMMQQACNCGMIHPYGTACVQPMNNGFAMPYNTEDNFSKLSKHVNITNQISYTDTTVLLGLFNRKDFHDALAASGYDGKPMNLLEIRNGVYTLQAASTMEDITQIIVELNCISNRVDIKTTKKNNK